jgi:hypothetical protein
MLQPVILAAALSFPACALAGVNATLNFTGVLTPGSGDRIEQYAGDNLYFAQFDGDPFTLSLHLTGTFSNPYIDSFSLQWTDPNYSPPSPWVLGWTGVNGVPFALDDGTPSIGFDSHAAVTRNGGSGGIQAPFFYIAVTDGSFNLDFSYSLSHPRTRFSSFTDNGVTGGGNFSASLDGANLIGLGPSDENSGVGLTFTSLTQIGRSVAPEPSSWAMLILGLGAIGAAARARRRCAPAPG